MSTSAGGYTHIVLWMQESAWPLQSQIVASDEVRREAGRLTLLCDGRAVFQAHSRDVARVEPHTSLQGARRAFAELQASRGRGGLRVVELDPSTGHQSPSTTLARGGPAEGIGFRIAEER